ncbi:hypothetical protein AVEN_189855-1, partial [Araneus ventricosus]
MYSIITPLPVGRLCPKSDVDAESW